MELDEVWDRWLVRIIIQIDIWTLCTNIDLFGNVRVDCEICGLDTDIVDATFQQRGFHIRNRTNRVCLDEDGTLYGNLRVFVFRGECQISLIVGVTHQQDPQHSAAVLNISNENGLRAGLRVVERQSARYGAGFSGGLRRIRDGRLCGRLIGPYHIRNSLGRVSRVRICLAGCGHIRIGPSRGRHVRGVICVGDVCVRSSRGGLIRVAFSGVGLVRLGSARGGIVRGTIILAGFVRNRGLRDSLVTVRRTCVGLVLFRLVWIGRIRGRFARILGNKFVHRDGLSRPPKGFRRRAFQRDLDHRGGGSALALRQRGGQIHRHHPVLGLRPRLPHHRHRLLHRGQRDDRRHGQKAQQDARGQRDAAYTSSQFTSGFHGMITLPLGNYPQERGSPRSRSLYFEMPCRRGLTPGPSPRPAAPCPASARRTAPPAAGRCARSPSA